MALNWLALGVVTGLLLLGGFVVLRRALAIVTVEGTSMVPTLHYGDRVLAWRLWPARWLRRGAIVVVKYEAEQEYPASPRRANRRTPSLYVKRLVGMPGDTLRWFDDRSPAVDEVVAAMVASGEFAGIQHAELAAGVVGNQDRVLTVPAGHLFVCGDNRRVSNDSREWGALPFQSLQGIVLLKMPGEKRAVGIAPTVAGLKAPPRPREYS